MTVDANGNMSVDRVPVEVFTIYESPFWNEHIGENWDEEFDWNRAVPVDGTIENAGDGYLSIQIEESDVISVSDKIFNWSKRNVISISVGQLDGPQFAFYRQ